MLMLRIDMNVAYWELCVFLHAIYTKSFLSDHFNEQASLCNVASTSDACSLYIWSLVFVASFDLTYSIAALMFINQKYLYNMGS